MVGFSAAKKLRTFCVISRLSYKLAWARANARQKEKHVRRANPEHPRILDPQYWHSTWGQLITKLAAMDGGPSIESRDGKLFRRRFRVPYPVYCDLVSKCLEKKLFGENAHLETDIAGRKICPVEIKLLAVLRILGRNWNFDDIAKATLMGETTARRANFIVDIFPTR